MYLPIGTVLPYAGPINDSIRTELKNNGFLLCDGTAYEQSQYNKLYEILKNVYGLTGTKFKVPDYRGYFLRGCDPSGARDPNYNSRGNVIATDKVGSIQADDFRSHQHFVGHVHSRSFLGAKDSDKPIKNSRGDSYYTNNTGGSETRPINIYVNYIIYFGI